MTDLRLANPATPPGLAYPQATSVLTHARALLTNIIKKFGIPLLVLAMRTYPRFIRANFLERLRDVEQLLRRFLAFEAMALAPSLTPARAAASPRAGPPQQDEIASADSTCWRAGFAILPSAPHDSGLRRQCYAFAAAATGSPPVPPAIPEDYATHTLARRLEAVIRVAADPAPCIRRLARRLRRKTPAGLRRVFAAPHTRCEETGAHLGLLTLHAVALLQRHTDSS